MMFSFYTEIITLIFLVYISAITTGLIPKIMTREVSDYDMWMDGGT